MYLKCCLEFCTIFSFNSVYSSRFSEWKGRRDTLDDKMKRWLSASTILIILVSGIFLSGCGLQQKKQRSGLQIETGNNQTVAIYLNGTYLNQTPLVERDLKPGTYTVKLVPTDPTYVSYEETITLHAGTVTWMIWNPGPSPETSGGTILEVNPLPSQQPWWQPFHAPENSGKLVFQSIPDNAIVAIASEDQVRFTPSEFIDIGEKPVSFSITLPSYETQSHTIELKPGYEVKIMSKLAKKDQMLAATTAQPAVLGSTDSATTSVSSVSANPKVKILPTQFMIDGKEVLRIRSAPDSSAATVDYALVGQTYPLSGERTADWIKIQTASGSGWISAAFTQEEASDGAKSK